jgi:hypothetical protein
MSQFFRQSANGAPQQAVDAVLNLSQKKDSVLFRRYGGCCEGSGKSYCSCVERSLPCASRDKRNLPRLAIEFGDIEKEQSLQTVRERISSDDLPTYTTEFGDIEDEQWWQNLSESSSNKSNSTAQNADDATATGQTSATAVSNDQLENASGTAVAEADAGIESFAQAPARPSADASIRCVYGLPLQPLQPPLQPLQPFLPCPFIPVDFGAVADLPNFRTFPPPADELAAPAQRNRKATKALGRAQGGGGSAPRPRPRCAVHPGGAEARACKMCAVRSAAAALSAGGTGLRRAMRWMARHTVSGTYWCPFCVMDELLGDPASLNRLLAEVERAEAGDAAAGGRLRSKLRTLFAQATQCRRPEHKAGHAGGLCLCGRLWRECGESACVHAHPYGGLDFCDACRRRSRECACAAAAATTIATATTTTAIAAAAVPAVSGETGGVRGQGGV